MRITSDDRRRHERVCVVKPCKVYLPAAQRFAPGRTCNISGSGALIAIESVRALLPGDQIDVTIAFSRLPVIPADRMIKGRVVRSEPYESDRQLVAVAFDEPLERVEAA